MSPFNHDINGRLQMGVKFAGSRTFKHKEGQKFNAFSRRVFLLKIKLHSDLSALEHLKRSEGLLAIIASFYR